MSADNDLWARYKAKYPDAAARMEQFIARHCPPLPPPHDRLWSELVDTLADKHTGPYVGPIDPMFVPDVNAEGPPPEALTPDGAPSHYIPERRADIGRPHIGEDQRPYYYLYRPAEKAGRARDVHYLQQNGTWGPWGSQVRTWTDKGEAELRLTQLLEAAAVEAQRPPTERPHTHPARTQPEIPEFIIGCPPYGQSPRWIYLTKHGSWTVWRPYIPGYADYIQRFNSSEAAETRRESLFTQPHARVIAL